MPPRQRSMIPPSAQIPVAVVLGIFFIAILYWRFAPDDDAAPTPPPVSTRTETPAAAPPPEESDADDGANSPAAALSGAPGAGDAEMAALREIITAVERLGPRDDAVPPAYAPPTRNPFFPHAELYRPGTESIADATTIGAEGDAIAPAAENAEATAVQGAGAAGEAGAGGGVAVDEVWVRPSDVAGVFPWSGSAGVDEGWQQQPPPASALSELDVSATIVRDDWGMARVNGEYLRPGERIGPFRLVRVRENGVTVEGPNGTEDVPLRQDIRQTTGAAAADDWPVAPVYAPLNGGQWNRPRSAAGGERQERAASQGDSETATEPGDDAAAPPRRRSITDEPDNDDGGGADADAAPDDERERADESADAADPAEVPVSIDERVQAIRRYEEQ